MDIVDIGATRDNQIGVITRIEETANSLSNASAKDRHQQSLPFD